MFDTMATCAECGGYARCEWVDMSDCPEAGDSYWICERCADDGADDHEAPGGFYTATEVDGESLAMHVTGDIGMSDEALSALQELAAAAYRQYGKHAT